MKAILVGYQLQIAPKYEDVSNLEDDPNFKTTPAELAFSGVVLDEESAIDAVRTYFKKIEELK